MKISRVLITAILFILSAFVLWIGFYYNVKNYNRHFAERIPTEIDGMKSTEINMDQHTLDILETEDVFYREYKKKDVPPVYLSVIFSENNRKVAHPPELCLSGGGNIVEEKKEIYIKNTIKKKFDVKRLIVNHGSSKWMYLYWYKTGRFFSSRYMLQQLLAAVTQLIYRKSSCALIRVSMRIPEEEEYPYKETQDKMVSFCRKVIPLTAEYLP